MSDLQPLIDVVARLRGPDGCAWDRAQTPASLAPHLIEETHEVVAAIESGDSEAVKEEIGDLLFVALLVVQAASDDGAFDLDGVTRGIVDKMVRRHPHVFAGAHEAPDWAASKATERGDADATSALEAVPLALPALARAQRVGRAAARVGFDWPDIAGVRAKVDEELAELDVATDPAHTDEELGDLLFALTNLARHLGVDAEGSLRRATAKFLGRFATMERLALGAGTSVVTLGADALEALWLRAKEHSP